MGWAVTEPTDSVYWPLGHLVCGVQESTSVIIIDSTALKNPLTHVTHWGWAMAVPATLVYLP